MKYPKTRPDFLIPDPEKWYPNIQPNKKPGEQNPTFLIPDPDPTFAYPTTPIDLRR